MQIRPSAEGLPSRPRWSRVATRQRKAPGQGIATRQGGAPTSRWMSTSSEPTGNTCYALNEVYESQAGVDDHWQQAQNWEHFGDLFAWACLAAALALTAAASANRPPAARGGRSTVVT